MVTTLDNLSLALDPYTNATLYTFTKGSEIDLSVTMPSATYVVPGVSGGLDPRGLNPNPIAPRTLKYKFWRIYATNGTYVAERDAIWAALGNRTVILLLVETDGTTRRNIAKLTGFPQIQKPADMAGGVEFALEFALDRPYWKGISSLQKYDTGVQYDLGQVYDTGPSLALAATSQTITLTNSGDAPEYEGVFSIRGPATNPVVLNQSVGIGNGNFMQFAYSGAIPSGSVLAVDTGLHIVTLDGVNVFGGFSWGLAGYAQREWMRVDPGANVFQVAQAAGVTGGVFSASLLDSWA